MGGGPSLGSRLVSASLNKGTLVSLWASFMLNGTPCQGQQPLGTQKTVSLDFEEEQAREATRETSKFQNWPYFDNSSRRQMAEILPIRRKPKINQSILHVNLNFSDLYDAWINERINHDLFVETWQNGVGSLDSNCTEQYKVLVL